MYVHGNPRTRKALVDMVKSGNPVKLFSPMMAIHEPPRNGDEFVEGPHYPEPHRWYAKVRIENGLVTKVYS